MTVIKTQTSPVAKQIAGTAARLFATRGYDATSVREIVEAAGVAKPTLYYYFGNKEGLAQALLTVPLSELVAEIRRIMGTVEDPVECLIGVMEAQFDLCRQNPDWARFVYAVMFGPVSMSIVGEFEERKSDLFSLIEASVRRLADAGIIAGEQVGACATACRGILLVGTLDYLYANRPLPLDFARRQIRRLLTGYASDEWRRVWESEE